MPRCTCTPYGAGSILGIIQVHHPIPEIVGKQFTIQSTQYRIQNTEYILQNTEYRIHISSRAHFMGKKRENTILQGKDHAFTVRRPVTRYHAPLHYLMIRTR